MPVYEYKCEACGGRFDRFVRGGDSGERRDCPFCGSTKVSRVFSIFGTGSAGRGDLSGSDSCVRKSG